jgi:hypothetical protein
MATPSAGMTLTDPGLNAPWSQYSLWSSTSKYNKSALDRFNKWSLWLAIGGAFLATLAEQIGHATFQGSLARVAGAATLLGVIATGAIALAAFFSRQAQGDNRVSNWTRSRSAAESLKSGIYLYRAGVQPFDGPDRAAQIKQRVDKVIEGMAGVEPRQPESEAVPATGPLTVNQYIADRVENQIGWYKKRAKEHQGKADRCRLATTVLMAIGALLTVFSMAPGVSAWAPVVAAMTAAITAHLKSQQYQMLTATYIGTAQRLRSLLGEFAASGKTDSDKAERNAFIQRCEDTMSSENGSWSGLWAKSS